MTMTMRTMSVRNWASGLVVAAVLAGGAGLVQAQTQIQWTGTTDVNWTTPTNWIGAAAPANDLVTNTASFLQATYSNQPTINTHQSIAGLLFTGGGAVTM
jgi:hypothetical protein